MNRADSYDFCVNYDSGVEGEEVFFVVPLLCRNQELDEG